MTLLSDVRRAGIVPLLPIVLAALQGGCASETARADDRLLPGRSRELLAHDWPHPSAYKYGASAFAAPDPKASLVRSPNRLRTYVIPHAADPVVRITAALRLGTAFEDEGERGASELLIHVLTNGRAADGTPIRAAIDGLGSRLQVEQGSDLATISLEVLPEDWRTALDLLIGMLRDRHYDEEAIKAWRAGPGYATPTAGTAGPGFRPTVELERLFRGTTSSLESGRRVTSAAVRAVADRALAPGAVVLGIGGSVERADAVTAISKLTSSWSDPDQQPRPARVAPVRQPSARAYMVDAAGWTGWIAFGHPVGPVPAIDEPAFAVLGEILNIRLNIAAREIRGLANKTSFELPTSATRIGLMHVRTGGRPEAVAPLIDVGQKELMRIRKADDPLAPEELEMVKGGLILGQWQRALDGARAASTAYAVETVRYGSTERLLDWPRAVQAVTAEQVKTAAQAYIRPEQLVTVVIGPVDQIRQARHPRWPAAFGDLKAVALP